MEEEYKFDESEASPSYSADTNAAADTGQPETAASGSGIIASLHLGKINWKRFTGPVIILVAILIFYLGFTYYTSYKNKAAVQDQISAQQQVAMMQQKQPDIKSGQELASSAPPPVPRLDVTVEMDKEKQAIQKNIDNLNQYVNSSKEYMSKLSNQVSSAQQEISVINQNIEQVVRALQHIFADVEKLKNPPKKKVKKKAKVPVAYHVRAIVPGRVWLESADGKNVTLRVGDRLAGYGEVQMISPRQGMVVMSNGSIIQYGDDDI